MFVLVLLWSGIYSGSCTGTQEMNVSPSSLSLGGILEGYSDYTPGDIRSKQGFNGKELDISLGCHQVYPWYIFTLPQWQSWEGRVWYLSVRDRLSPTREGKLWCKVCLHPHLEQGGTPPVEKMALVAFFPLLQMGANNSSLTPLNCILKNWDRFDPQSLKKTCLIFLCDPAWPRYPLEDGKWWPVGGSLNYNTVLQLDLSCRKQGKWVEVAYVLPFFSL